jgi:hypothetical protein
MKPPSSAHRYQNPFSDDMRAPVVVSRRRMLREALNGAPARRSTEAKDRAVAASNRTGSLEKLYGKSAPERLARMQEELGGKGRAANNRDH